MLAIILNLISAFIIFLGGVFFNKILLKKIKKLLNPLRRLFPFNFDKSNKIIITYGYVIPSESNNYTLEQGDLTALLSVKDLLSTVVSETKLEINDSMTLYENINNSQNIFSLSGPKWNRVSEYFIGKFGSPVTFSKKPRGLAVFTSRMNEPVIYRTIRDDRELAKTCYGVILGGTIVENAVTHNVVLCCGRTTLSTNGTLLYLKQILKKGKQYEELKKRGLFKSKNKWAVLIKVERNIDLITDLKRPLIDSDVNITLINVFLEEDFIKPFSYKYEKV